MDRIIDNILDKLIDDDLIKTDDYPSTETCYADVKDIIRDVLRDYIIIQGEILQ